MERSSVNVSGIIFEGIPGTGKTTVLAELLQSNRWLSRPFLSSVVLTEHQTLRVLEAKRQAGAITKRDNLSLLNHHVKSLEDLQQRLEATNWLKRDRTAQKVPFIFERFHLSHLYHYDYLKWADVASIDERLARLNATLFLFTIDPTDIQERIINDYKKSGWGNYLKTIGSTDTAISEYFIAKQTQFISMAEHSKLPLIQIDSSRSSPLEIVDSIMTHWKFLT